MDLTAFDLFSISIHAPAKGATFSFRRDSVSPGISIHAPAKGATNPRRKQKYKYTAFQSTLPRRERPSKITYFFSNIDFYLGNTNKLQYCSFHFTILLIIFLLLSMVRTPLPFYVRLPPAPAYIIRIPSAS